ncbi:hypothetical protein [Rhizobium binae]|uniref:hypothetical protein n=1 Tax=Rhizobium binae TaxID=1138190 RepID=UPI001C839CD2|nr:hypothetical protein [Rhizobium binae]MBX4964476.1 hypothetical protein [Rhizobium binae]MBX4967191.1 hypothetical protein [Rhizobium binae]
MPVRRRAGKRRSTEGLDQWFFVFSSGFDYFRELEEIGIDLDDRGRPSREDVEAAWRRLGEAFMDIPRHPDQGEPWAVTEFGDPRRSSKRRR